MRHASRGVRWIHPWAALAICVAASMAAADETTGAASGDAMIADYFQRETAKLRDASLADVKTLDDWTARREQDRRRLFEMLSLDPLPERTPLEPVVTGRVESDAFWVEKLQFQSRPGLYVTANLYVPKNLEQPAPAILYLCGHGRVEKDGVSLGNKVHYQHHGAWFARHGYVCLVIDTLQLGEIEGIHHGAYRHGMWWWNDRGYTPAGVEAWNAIRSLDYLETRPEVDRERMGATGRSGGGAYSWWIAALDDRIQVAVPVAGITDLENHVVDGCVEGHCDCMYTVNTYRWDYAQVAALVAPRPLLISNSDKDGIFPLEGVLRIHDKVRRIYRLYGAGDQLGLQITEGPHADTQELRIHAFHWFNRFLKGEKPLIDEPARPAFEPEQLKVFESLPGDERNTRIQESFVPRAAKPSIPADEHEWRQARDAWRAALDEKSFAGWPRTAEALALEQVFSATAGGVLLERYDFISQSPFRLRLYLVRSAGDAPLTGATLTTLDAPEQRRWLAAMRTEFSDELSDEPAAAPDAEAFAAIRDQLTAEPGRALAFFAPRGVGAAAWSSDEKTQKHNRRRFMLLGQTLEGMQVWDVRRAMQALRRVVPNETPLAVSGEAAMGGVALYASLYEPPVVEVRWRRPSRSHDEGPHFLNVARYLDLPQAVAMAAERSNVILSQTEADAWTFPRRTAAQLAWPAERLQLMNESGT